MVMTRYRISNRKVIVTAETRDGIVILIQGPPIVRRFLGQSIGDLRRWFLEQGDHRWRMEVRGVW